MARILIAKLGTDAHDFGVTVVARWLADAGHEVTYAGLYNTPERLSAVALEEDPDLIGLSFLGGEPVYLTGRVKEFLSRNGLGQVPLMVGGVITPEMRGELEALGVGAVFTPGAKRQAIVEGVAAILAARAQDRTSPATGRPAPGTGE